MHPIAPLSVQPARIPSPEAICYHCHDVCRADKVQLEDKTFCCEGCKMVYEILNINDLCQYYTIDPNAGNSIKGMRDARTYAFLDDQATADKLIQFNDGRTAKVQLLLPDMHCASCIWLLEHLYRLDAGVLNSKVNFIKKDIVVSFDPSKTNLRKIAAMLASIGYPPEINLGDVEGAQAQTSAHSRKLLYQLGVAGFAFGNIMLLSFPEYLGLEKHVEGAFFGLFGWLNLLFATPVLLFSSRDYLRSAWNGVVNGHLNIDVPVSLGIIMLYGRSAVEIVMGTGAGYMDSFTGLIFFLLCGKWFQQKTYYHLSFERDYKSYFPVAASRKTSRGEESVPVSKLQSGDTIIIRNQELIPADGVLLKGKAQVDYSFVTGEAEPVQVEIGERIYAGGRQVGGSIDVTLTHKVNQSYLTRLWNDEAFKTPEKTHAHQLADLAGRWFTWLILAVGIGGALYWGFQGQWGRGVNVFTAVMMVSCPCAIAVSLPFSLGNVLRILGRNGFYLKNNEVIESFSTVDAVVFDKTGTISTRNQGENPLYLDHLSDREKVIAHSLALHSNHPVSWQLRNALKDVPLETVEHYEEIPGKGVQGWVGETLVKLGSADFVRGQQEGPKGLHLAVDGAVSLPIAMSSAYRDGLDRVVKHFKGNSAIWLLSGDNDQEAAQLKAFFPGTNAMHFNQSPQDKLNFVRELQQFGQKVLMIGDGLNDAGALRQSNVGLVISENTNNFTPACDAILRADRFNQLPDMLNLMKSSIVMVKWTFLLSLCYNIWGLTYAVSGNLSPIIAAILMPLSSVTLVLLGIGLGNWKARQLGL